MASFRSRVRHFRAPVVVTVALGAMPGCSGKTLDDDGHETRLTSCPAGAPAAGASCDYEGPACGYDPCGTYPTKTATCKDGAWSVSIQSCNPPPPNGICPDAVPAQQSSCDYQGPSCEYGDCYGRRTHQATCVDNHWRIVVSSCNPPPPPAVVCPIEKPVSGAYCNYAGPECEYDYCGGFATTRATCDGAAWTVSHSSCNPPPPTCPAVAPAIGSLCVSNGLGRCEYQESCGPFSVECRNGVWAVAARLPTGAAPEATDAGVGGD